MTVIPILILIVIFYFIYRKNHKVAVKPLCPLPQAKAEDFPYAQYLRESYAGIENTQQGKTILKNMQAGMWYAASEIALIMNTDNDDDWSPQRVSAILKQLRETGQIVSKEYKRRIYFAKI